MQAFKRLPLALLLGKVLIVGAVLVAQAQSASAQDLKQDLHHDLSYCAKQFDYTPVQLLQLEHLKQQHNLSQEAHLQSYLKILTPAQQQELAHCTKAQIKQQ